MTRKNRDLRAEIIEYLAVCPDRNLTEIINGIKAHRNSVSKAVAGLREAELVTSLSSYLTYGDKGVNVDRWGLTQQGMGQYMINVQYSQIKMRAMFNAYKGYDIVAGCWLTIIKAIEAEKGKKNDIIGTFNKYGATLLSNGIPTGDMFHMFRGYLTSKMNDAQLTRVYDKLENYSRNWEKNNMF